MNTWAEFNIHVVHEYDDGTTSDAVYERVSMCSEDAGGAVADALDSYTGKPGDRLIITITRGKDDSDGN